MTDGVWKNLGLKQALKWPKNAKNDLKQLFFNKQPLLFTSSRGAKFGHTSPLSILANSMQQFLSYCAKTPIFCILEVATWFFSHVTPYFETCMKCSIPWCICTLSIGPSVSWLMCIWDIKIIQNTIICFFSLKMYLKILPNCV